MKQRTLSSSFTLKGKGLHTGLELVVTFNPAPVNHGYKIKRVDVEGQPVIDAIAENVVSFNVYPNPVSDNLVIETEANIEAVTIYTVTGVVVYSEVDFNNNTIDVSDFANGVYIMKVRTENGEAVQRFIKK